MVFKLMNDCENALTSLFSLIVRGKSNSIEFRHLHNHFTGLGVLALTSYPSRHALLKLPPCILIHMFPMQTYLDEMYWSS